MASLSSCDERAGSGLPPSGIDTTGISSEGAVVLRGQIVMIPPPALIAREIRNKEIPFNSSIVSATGVATKPISARAKALRLGMLGADLTYCISHEQTQEIPLCLSHIRSLAVDLDLMQDVDSSLLYALEDGINDPLRLLGLHSGFFRSMENHLKQSKRSDISACILIGGWIETVYQLASLSDSLTALDPLLAEQRHSASSVLRLAKELEDDEMKNLIADLEPLCEAFSELEHVYTFREPMHDKRERITYLRSKSTVTFDSEKIEWLHALIRTLRQNLIAS